MVPAPQWVTVDLTRSTLMSDEDQRRLADKIIKYVRGATRPPAGSSDRDDDPDDGLAGAPARR